MEKLSTPPISIFLTFFSYSPIHIWFYSQGIEKKTNEPTIFFHFSIFSPSIHSVSIFIIMSLFKCVTNLIDLVIIKFDFFIFCLFFFYLYRMTLTNRSIELMMKSIINRKYGTNIFDWVYFILLLTVNFLFCLMIRLN